MDDRMDDPIDTSIPSTESSGTLDPPPPTPPVAAGEIYPLAPDPNRPVEGNLESAAAFVGEVARRALDFLDELGDAIAETVGLRA